MAPRGPGSEKKRNERPASEMEIELRARWREPTALSRVEGHGSKVRSEWAEGGRYTRICKRRDWKEGTRKNLDETKKAAGETLKRKDWRREL